MRFIFLTIAVLAVGVSAGRRAPVTETAGRPRPGRVSNVLGGAHFGWGLDELANDHLDEETEKVKDVSEKKIKKVDKSEPEMKAHRHWHLPACDHCSDVDNAFDGLE